jgi:hypothetical protein
MASAGQCDEDAQAKVTNGGIPDDALESTLWSRIGEIAREWYCW